MLLIFLLSWHATYQLLDMVDYTFLGSCYYYNAVIEKKKMSQFNTLPYDQTQRRQSDVQVMAS